VEKALITNTVKITWQGHEVDVPVNIVNKELYAEYQVLDNQRRTAKDRYWECPNGKKVDLFGSQHFIKRDMLKNGCQQKSVDKAFEISGKFKKIAGRLISMKRRFNSIDGNSYRTSPVLEERYSEILDLFGKYYTETEVHRIISTEWEYKNLTFNEVKKFAIQNRDKIAELRRQQEEEYSDISIHSKRSQLGKLNYLLQDRMQHYEKKPTIENSREIRAIIMDAVKIVNGNQIKLDISGKIDIEATLTVSMEYQQTVLKQMTIQQLVLSRVAAKLNVNPIMLMSRLAHSWYSKFNGFNKNDDLINSKPLYPSAINYDFSDLGVKFEKQEGFDDRMKELPIIKDIEVVEDISARILKLIKEKKQTVDSIKDKHNPNIF
jgi:hypothetical protein